MITIRQLQKEQRMLAKKKDTTAEEWCAFFEKAAIAAVERVDSYFKSAGVA